MSCTGLTASPVLPSPGPRLQPGLDSVSDLQGARPLGQADSLEPGPKLRGGPCRQEGPPLDAAGGPLGKEVSQSSRRGSQCQGSQAVHPSGPGGEGAPRLGRRSAPTTRKPQGQTRPFLRRVPREKRTPAAGFQQPHLGHHRQRAARLSCPQPSPLDRLRRQRQCWPQQSLLPPGCHPSQEGSEGPSVPPREGRVKAPWALPSQQWAQSQPGQRVLPQTRHTGRAGPQWSCGTLAPGGPG